MKITAIKPYPAWSVWRNVFLVKIETDEGIYGWGEGVTSWRELGVKGVTEHFSQWLIGSRQHNTADRVVRCPLVKGH